MTSTKRQPVIVALLALSFGFAPTHIKAQCPQIEAIMVDACGTEQLNEFVVIRSGAGFNTSDIQLDFDVNNNILGPNNNDINTDNGNWSADPTPCGLTTGNTAAFTGCSNLIAVGPGVDIPANAVVILQTSFNATNNNYNFSSLCSAGQCIYVIASSCTRSAGGFTNGGGGGTRTTNFSIAGTCVQTITYNLASLVGGNGAYYLPFTNTYGNGGCIVPPVAPATMFPPNISPIANVAICGTYTLPPITGTNLTPNAAYYTGPNGTGTQYNPGDEISSNTTLYAYDHNGPLGCSDQEPFTITIITAPTANQPADVVVCAGQTVNVPVNGSPGATFPWTNDNTAIGLGASGTGNINFPAANVGATELALITITPTQGSCTGTPVTFTITVNPRPTVDDPPNQSLCAGDPLEVFFSSPSGSPTYTWTNSNPAIGLPNNGTGDISTTAANVATTQTATITVTPSENGCPGTPQTFTITVVPVPVVNQPANVAVCAGQAVNIPLTGSPGATFNWTNDNPAIGLGASGTGSISFPAAAVAFQEVATITVTPTNAAGTCTGNPVTFTITVNPGPAVDPPIDQSVCAGDFVSVMFSSPGNPTYAWTNTNTAIGLPASGSGSISFNAANVATTQTGTITVTPSQAGCIGLPQTFTITVSPVPFVMQPNNVTACGGSPVTVNFTGTPGASFDWFSDNTAIGLGASGSGNISFTAANVAVQETATITVIPTIGPCDGIQHTFTITINPIPTMDDPPNQSVCGGNAVSVNFTSSNNPTYSWTNSNTGIGLAASGNGNISFTTAFVATTQTATITVTPTENGCPGTPQTFTITVNPAPTVNLPANLNLCAGQSIVISLSGTPGATFNWVNSNPAIGLPASGSGNISLTTAAVATTQTGTVTITPNIGSCNGVPVSFTITVKPLPAVDDPADQTVCGGAAVAVNFTGTGSPAFNWTNNNPAIGLPASGSGNISFNAANVATTQTATLTVTPVQNGCTGTAQTFTITVNPASTVNQPANVSVCNGEPVAVNFTGAGGATFAWTNDNTAIGLPASGNGNISFNAANVATAQTATITVTPSGGACAGAPVSFTVTVSPGVSVDNPGNQSACVGDTVGVHFTGTGNPVFSWTNDNPLIGLAASGVGDFQFVAANVVAPETGTITVTPQAMGAYAYITNLGSDNVSVIDLNTNAVVATIPVGNAPYGVWVSPDGSRVYVTNRNIPGTVSVINTSTNTVVATINVGNEPVGVTVSPDGTRVYVTNQNVNLVSVIDAATNTVIATIPTAPTTLFGIVCSPDGSKVYVASNFNSEVLVIDAATNTITTTINLGLNTGDKGLAISPDGTRLYVTNQATNTVSVINTLTNTILTTIPTGTAPHGIVVSPDGTRVYATNENSDDVTVINATNNTVVTTVPVGFGPIGVDITTDGKWVYVANVGSNNVSVIDAATNTVVQTIGVGFSPVSFGHFIRHASACTGAPQTFTITVGPVPTLIQPNNVSVCGNVTTKVQFSASAGATVNWTNSNPAIGLPASGSGDINFIAANVAATQTAIITATPMLGSCSGTPVTFTVTVNPAAMGSISGNLLLCIGDSTTLTASGGVSYEWNNSAATPSITVSPPGPSTYSVIITNAFGCPVAVSALVDVKAAPVAAISGNTTLCAGDSTILTASGGTSYAWSPSGTSAGITVKPLTTTTYTVTVTNAFACTDTAGVTVTVNQPDAVQLSVVSCNPADTGVQVLMLQTLAGCDSIVTITTTLSPSDSLSLTQYTCNPASAGVFTNSYTNQFGCDSTVVTTIIFDPAAIDTTYLTKTTCDPAQAGIDMMMYTGSDGCDSLVFTTTNLVPSDTVQLSQTTCDPAAAGVFPQNLVNQYGCDSLVVTTITYDPSTLDTTYLAQTTCNAAQAGTFQMPYTGSDGCDSLVITTITLLPGDTVQVFQTTCDPAAAGVFPVNLVNQYGCDSLVVTTITYDPSTLDTTYLNQTTCNAAQAGIFPVQYTGSDGCDSLVITTIALLPSDTVQAFQTTCDPAAAGVFPISLVNQYGCDSTVILTITLQPSDTVNLTVFTCDSSSANVTTLNLFNQYGCDSIVTITTVFDPSLIDITFLTGFTCDPALATTTQTQYTGVDGCDSLVVLTLLLNPSDTITVTSFTCDPSTAGTFIDTLQNQYGCDSLLISVVIFDPLACAPSVVISGANPTCGGGSDGSFTLQILNGQPPLRYDWAGSAGNTGTGQIANPANPVVVGNLPSGNYTVTITDLNNQASATVTVTLTAPPVLTTNATATSAFNGYAVSCAGAADGAATATANGGTPPYQFLWNNGNATANTANLSAGSYSLVVTDANGCTAASNVTLGSPPPLQFSLALQPANCGDTLADATIMASGGLAPYTVLLDGNTVAGTMPAIGAGTHTVSLVDANGCTADSTLTLNLPPAPEISLPADTSVVLGHTLRIEATTNLTDWKSLTWQPLPDSACPNCLAQEWTPGQSQVIKVTIEDTFGCTAQAMIRISVERVIELFVPNAFSPNDDGFNDTWLVNAGASVIELQDVQVFDRWGNLQFSWNNPLPPNVWPGWDGRTRGKKADLGVYVYYIKVKLADGSTQVIKGDVTILER